MPRSGVVLWWHEPRKRLPRRRQYGGCAAWKTTPLPSRMLRVLPFCAVIGFGREFGGRKFCVKVEEWVDYDYLRR